MSELGEILDLNWRFFSVWFKKFFVLAIVMTGFRYLSFDALKSQGLLSGVSNEQVFDLFVLGFRFDSMICAFFMIPFVFILLLRLSLSDSLPNYHIVFYSTRIGAVFWCLSSLIFAVDFHFLKRHHRHMRFEDWRDFTHPDQLTQFVNVSYDVDFFFSVLCLLGLTYVGFRYLLDESDFYVDRGSVLSQFDRKFELGLKFLLPLVLTALIARGSVGSHHLGARHAAALSEHKNLNELALNPLWTLNKRLD